MGFSIADINPYSAVAKLGYDALNRSRGGSGPQGPAPWNPITAANTTIPTDLVSAFGNVGQNGLNGIGTNYGQLSQRQTADSAARGLPAGSNSYGTQRLGVQQGLDSGALQASLGGQIASTAYNNRLQQRDYGQQASLAQQIAALNRPNLLQQIFQGIGTVGKPAAQLYGAGAFNGGNSYANRYANAPASNYGPLSLPNYSSGYGYPNPSMAFGGQ